MPKQTQITNFESKTEFIGNKVLMFMNCLREIKRRKEEPMWNYMPSHGEAEKFHNSQKHYRLIMGGNRGGKTYASCYEACALAMGCHPTKDIQTPTTGWVVIVNFIDYLPIIKDTIEKMIPARMIRTYPKKDNQMYELKNGSKIYIKSANKGNRTARGESVDWIWIDEQISEDYYKSLLPRVISKNGYIWMSVTHEEMETWIHDNIYLDWKKGNSIWDVFFFYMEANRYNSDEGIENFKSLNLSEDELRMRMFGDFAPVGANRVFPDSQIDYILELIQKPVWCGEIMTRDFKRVITIEDKSIFEDLENDGLYVWQEPRKGARYFIGVDPSAGVADKTAIVVIKDDITSFEIVAVYNKTIPPEDIVSKIWSISTYYNEGFVVVERNNGGQFIVAELVKYYDVSKLYFREKDMGGYKLIDTTKIGLHTDMYMKLKMISDMKKVFTSNKKRIWIYCKELYNQLKLFIETKKKQYRAQYGNDDMLMALMLGLQGYFSEQFYSIANEEEVQEVKKLEDDYYAQIKRDNSSIISY